MSLYIIEKLNPGVSKSGFVVFDVPEDRKYRIELPGGLWSVKDAYVRLSPKGSAEEAFKAASQKMEKLPRLVDEALVRLKKEAKGSPIKTYEEATERLNQIIDELERAALSGGERLYKYGSSQ